MALTAVHATDVPNLNQVREHAALSPNCPTKSFSKGGIHEDGGENGKILSFKLPNKFVMMGHRGTGVNLLHSPDPRMKAIKENTIRSLNAAGKFNVDFVEFDVQVTRDGCPVIFHDIFISTEEEGVVIERRVTDLCLDEFLSYGPQRNSEKVGKPLLRKTEDGKLFKWKVEDDDHLCTLQEVFQSVDHPAGFNIELKFDNNIVYEEEELERVLKLVLQVVFENCKDRPIIFSSFHPDAVQLIRRLQSTYPVLFITKGGTQIFSDVRRNSLDEAIKVCLEGNLQGIVSEVKAILKNTGAVKRAKESNLSLLTFGLLNNVPEVVYTQYLMGIEGVIVDLVKEITESVKDFSKLANRVDGEVFIQEDRVANSRLLQEVVQS